jgi:hypothetical protein
LWPLGEKSWGTNFSLVKNRANREATLVPLFALSFTSAMALWLGGKTSRLGIMDLSDRSIWLAYDYQRNRQGYVGIIGAARIACQEPAIATAKSQDRECRAKLREP